MSDDCARPLAKALATDATDTSFASKVPTLTEPSGNGVIDLVRSGVLVPRQVLAFPYATGDDDATFDLRLVGWKSLRSGNTVLWIPAVLVQATATLGTSTGVAGAPVAATERFPDTLALHATVTAQGKTTDTDSGGAASSGTVVFHSPVNNLIAYMRVPLEGFQKLEFTFDSTHASVTAMNCLYALL